MVDNWNKIEKSWNAFAKKYNMSLQDIDQNLFTNKRKIYTAIEKIEDIDIYYRYVYFKLDTIDSGNDFRIIIPILTNKTIKISRTKGLNRLLSKKNLNILPEGIKISNNTNALITNMFEEVKDLKISIGIKPIAPFELDRIESVLEIHTKKLSEEITNFERLREFVLSLHKELKENKIIMPAPNRLE